jgi:hypothetical protein
MTNPGTAVPISWTLAQLAERARKSKVTGSIPVSPLSIRCNSAAYIYPLKTMISSLIGFAISVTDDTVSIEPGETVLIRPTCPSSLRYPSDPRSGRTAFEEAIGTAAEYVAQILLAHLPTGDIRVIVNRLGYADHFRLSIHNALQAHGQPKNVVIAPADAQ